MWSFRRRSVALATPPHFELDALVAVEVNKLINHFVGLREGSRLAPVDALCFENRKEIIRHGIVIRVSTS